MSKIRVYELARDLGLESKDLVDFLEELGADVKNHMSTIEDDIAELVREHFSKAGSAGQAAGGKAPQDAGEAGRKAPAAAAAQPPPRRAGEQKPQRHDDQDPARGREPRHGKGRGPGGRGEAEAGRETRGTLVIPDTITVKDFADKLGVPAAAIIKTLMNAGVIAGINQSIDHDAAAMVAEKLGFTVERPQETKIELLDTSEDPPEALKERPPVVTIMGHVDHGKTTLLDAIRQTRVVETEAGGITQHIGAYQVERGGKKITFIDTPGHEAFTAMRSRGAQVTDIAVLVVAADDGVMPQTVEAINHAKAAGVPIIVAVNKMDRPGANIDRVKQQLVEHDLVPEDWGGDTIVVPVVAIRGEGIDELLEMILLVAELRELKANPDRPGQATVIESELDKGKGPVATILVRNGTVRVGDAVVVGAIAGRVRALIDENGRPVKEAGPSMPVQVLGLSEVPQAGDFLEVVSDERTAREIAASRQEQAKNDVQRAGRVRLAELFSRVQEGEVKDLNILVKADAQGSVEALRHSLEKLSTDQVRVNVIHGAAGGITESDVNLAAASNAIIIGFNVRPETSARNLAEREGVDIRLYRVIYDAIEEVQKAMEGLLEPKFQEVVLGRAEVRATFKVPGVGTVAGCYVVDGKVARNAQVRLLRDNVVVYEGRIASLKRFKDDVREVQAGYECGIGIERFNDIKEGDVIEAFEMQQV
ncbi:MAG: translation initiation factor IF-2 [Clostridia bacterium]|nr:translation initiation factor IF-2 [Bacillota bacterium]MBO2520358.1 translation initiation factor IF-2 [Bacillota bacterium]